MGRNKNLDLTENEKAAVYYHVFAGCKNRDTLLRIAYGPDHVNGLALSTAKTKSNYWFNSFKIQKYIETIQEVKNNMIASGLLISEPVEGDQTEQKEGQKAEFLNLLDRDVFLDEINKRANKVTEEKEKREYLKMISDNLRYKDSENGENNDIQRFYMPILCQDCPLYQKENEK
jgi:hypothetical protein